MSRFRIGRHIKNFGSIHFCPLLLQELHIFYSRVLPYVLSILASVQTISASVLSLALIPHTTPASSTPTHFSRRGLRRASHIKNNLPSDLAILASVLPTVLSILASVLTILACSDHPCLSPSPQ